MKKVVSLAFVVSTAMITFLQTAISQTAKDIFNSTDMTVTYLGVVKWPARLITHCLERLEARQDEFRDDISAGNYGMAVTP